MPDGNWMEVDELKKHSLMAAHGTIVDAATQAAVGGRDLALGDVSQVAFGPHLYLCLEQGIKWLVRQETGQKHPDEKSHGIGPVYDALSDEHKCRLGMAFDDAMRFYGYAYLDYDGLGEYLQKHGSQSNFNQMRYFLLPGESDDLLRGIVFGIHIRLIEEVHSLFLGGDFRTLEATIGWNIEAAVPVTWSWSSKDVERKGAVQRAITLLQVGAKPVAPVLRDVVQQGLGDPSVKSLLGQLVRKLKEGQAEHPTYAMHHYLCTLEYRLPGSESAVDVQAAVEWPRKGSAIVRTPSGEWLGIIERRHDGTWLATAFRSSGIFVIFDDAVRYLVNKRTVVLLINGQAKRVMAFDSDAQFQVLEGNGREDSTIELAFWDESHGIRAGGNLNIVQEGSIMVRTVEGKVEHVDGRKVSLSVKNNYFRVPSTRQNA